MFYNKNLDIIRGMAAFFVVFYHYAIFFFTDQKFCARLCCCLPIEFVNPLIDQLGNFPFDLGQFAVGCFFFLSGYLVTSLVDRYPTRKAFFRNRFFRLWPIYAVGLLINIIAVQAGASYSGLEFTHSSTHLFSSLLCLRDFLGYPYITGIVWTFEIEVKFVFACLIVFPLLKQTKPGTLLIGQIILFSVLATFYLNAIEDENFSESLYFILKALTFGSKYFCMLLMGLILYYFVTDKISKGYCIALCLLTFLSFTLEESITASAKTLLSHCISYGIAFLIFSFVLLRKNQPQRGKLHSVLLKGVISLSKISYPLYLIHAVPGYVLMYILYDHGYSLGTGILLSVSLSLIIAFWLHKYVEEPFHHGFMKRKLREA